MAQADKVLKREMPNAADQQLYNCPRCPNNLEPETARTDADSVRVQRVGRLCARWRERSQTLRQCADDLEAELAGMEPTDLSSETALEAGHGS